MARKKGVIKQISNYGEKHPYVTLALAGTFGYYLYENMVKPRMADEGPDMRYAVQGIGMTTSTSTTTSSSHGVPGMIDGSTGEMSMDIDPTKSGLFGLGRSIQPDPQSDKFLNEQLLTKSISGGRRNPPAHLMFDKSQGLGACHKCGTRSNPHCHCGGSHGMNGFSPSARRRVGHAGIGMATESYEPTLDTQFSNQEAMITGDLKKHEDILGFSGLMPLAGGDWYE